MKKFLSQSGFSFAEILVVVALMGILGTAGVIVFNEGSTITSVVLARIELQNNLRHFSQRLTAELQESGEDQNGVIQVTIFNNTGVNNSDILRFAVPICPCATYPIDQDGEVASWGAPLVWGQSGCNAGYTVLNNGKVEVCHRPPGNPTNTQNLQVDENAVKAHLAHEDYLGDCSACDPLNYTNRWIEYLMDANGQILRRILDINGNVLNSVVATQDVSDFQTNFGTGQDSVVITIDLATTAAHNRNFTLSGNWEIKLRNKD